MAMRKLAVYAIAVAVCASLWGCAELAQLAPPPTGPRTTKPGLTNQEVIAGLKEALVVGATNSTGFASKVDGFYKNPSLYIPFPEEAVKMKKTLVDAGFGNLVADFEKSLNRAAEESTKKALPIFKSAIMGMTVTDAMGILRGSNNAATTYLKSKTEAQLRAEFLPVAKQAIQSVEVTKYWNPVVKTYNRLTLLTGGTAVNPNLDEYVTQKAIDGLFLLIAQEEAKIRKDPAARVTDILKKVFANS
mgnify:CR=1 FL=1